MSNKFPRTIYKGHEDGTLYMVFKGVKHFYDELLVNDMEELEAGEEMGYIDSYHDAIFGIEIDTEPSDQESEDPETDEESESEADSETDEEF